MPDAETDNVNQVEAFLADTGVAQAIMQDSVAVGLRHRLTSEGAVVSLRRDDCLHLRALLARRWHWSSAERIEAKLVGDILTLNPYARVQAVRVHKVGRYVEAQVNVT